MGETQGITGFGTLLKIGDGESPEDFNPIAEVKDITGPSLSREFAEFTHQQSPNGYREFKPTFKLSGDVTFQVNFLPDDPTQGFDTSGLIKDYEDGTLRNFQMAYPDPGATKLNFSAYVANLSPVAPMANPLAMNITLRVTGPCSWT